MSQVVMEIIPELNNMKKYPPQIFYEGNLSLLNRPKVSIVGTRRPSNYTRQFTYALSKALAKRGVCVVSGAAMGVDTIAHEGAGFDNTKQSGIGLELVEMLVHQLEGSIDFNSNNGLLISIKFTK